MKNILLLLAIILSTNSTCLNAHEDTTSSSLETEHEHPEESPYYIVIAGLLVFGDTLEHNHATLSGDRGYGIGIDVGYRLGDGFAIEYDFTYARNTVSSTQGANMGKAQALYYTSALDIVYTYEAFESVGIFVKVGYEYEWESVSDFNIDEQGHGFLYGGGTEIAVNEEYKIILEYEYSMIEGFKGHNAVFAGLMLNF